MSTQETAIVRAAEASLEAYGAKLTPEEAMRLNEILANKGTPEDLIPDGTPPERVWEYFSVCCKSVTYIEKAGEVIQRYVGRLLVMMQRYPEIYKSRGYRTLDDFISRGAEQLFGMSRATAYRLKRIAEAFPSLSAQDYTQIGTTKLGVLAKVTSEKDPTTYRELLEKARQPEVTSEILIKTAVEQNLASNGDLETKTLVILANRRVAERWMRFIKDPIIQSIVGNQAEGVILDTLMDECEPEWRARANDIMRQ